MAARNLFPAEQLRVFDKLPGDEVNTTIDEIFVPKAGPAPAATESAEVKRRQGQCLAALREKVFAGWPAEHRATQPALLNHSTQGGLRLATYALDSQAGLNLPLIVAQDPKVKRPEKLLLTVLDTEAWTNSTAKWLWLGGGTAEAKSALRQEMQAGRLAVAYFAPRSVEPAKWSKDTKKSNQIRRRYALLGQTLDSMRVWDIRCAAQAVKALPEFKKVPLCIRAKGQMGVNSAYAALFEPAIQKLQLEGAPAAQAEGPDYPNALRVWDLPQLWEALGERVEARSP
jgi:hypothetical protein